MEVETITQLAEQMQAVLTGVADRLGRESGFIQRERKLRGSSFAQSLVFGWLANPQSSMEELSQSAANIGLGISRQGLDDRFSPVAAEFLRRLVEATLEQGLAVPIQQPARLAAFQGIYLLDSTVIKLPAVLAEVWPGCQESSLKISVCWELQTGALQAQLHAGREHDQRSVFQHQPLPEQALRLTDLGYFDLEVLHNLAQNGVYWVIRYKVGSHLAHPDGQPLDLLGVLPTQASGPLDLPVLLGKARPLACRLIAEAVPEAVYEQRCQALADWEGRHQTHASSERRALLAWSLYLTNAEPERLPPDQLGPVAHLRWQVEKLFDLWKTVGALDKWRTRNPWRILCEVYAKLIALVIQHWLLLTGEAHDLKRSAYQAARTIRKKAWQIATLLHDLPTLIQTLVALRQTLLRGCGISHSSSSPPSFQHFFP